MSATSTGMCTAAWLPSTSTGTPSARAAAQIAFTSTTVPSTFDICVTRDQLRPRPDRVDHLLRVERAVGLDVDPLQHHPLPLAQEVPGHDVGVMLHHAQHDLVARLEPRRRPGVADHVDPHGRAGGEDDLVLVRRAEEALHDAARRLVLLGRDGREVVQPAMHVGVVVRIGLGDRVDHHLRLLRRGAVVEIDQRPAVHLAARGSGNRGAPPRRRTSGDLLRGDAEDREQHRSAKNSTIAVRTTAPSTMKGFWNPCSSATKFA